jgi:prepilin-type N-terminal cleavage/methylation domain-containing protein
MSPTTLSSRSRSGFTLVEILAVLAVIAAIIAIGIPAVAKVLQSARLRNAEGTASVVRSALTGYLSKPGSLGTIPVTESAATAAPALPAAQWSGPAALNTPAAAKAATLDNVLLAEGLLDRPLSLRLGAQNFALAAGAVPVTWSPVSETFTNATAPTADYSGASRSECAICDGTSNPGATGAAAGSASCAFNLAGNGLVISAGTRVAFLVLRAVPAADAYQLALDVDGPGLLQNTAALPAAADQTLGAVAYAKDGAGTGLVDVYYYLTSL